MSEQTYEPGTHPDLAPPSSTTGVYGWLRQNLFSSPMNVGLTLFSLYLVYTLVPPVVQWAFIDADWSLYRYLVYIDADWTGAGREACSRQGACWVFVGIWFKQFMYGRYPNVELWRINTAYVLLVAAAIPLFVPGFRWKHWVAVFLLVVYPLIALYLFVGMSNDTVEAWPYRLMGFAAMALGALALLPLLGIWRERSAVISVVLIVLTPLWGLSAASTWTGGLLWGASGFVAVLAVVLAVVPGVALAAGLMLSPWRTAIANKFGQLSVLVAALAIVGYALPLVFWDDVAGPSPPWPMVVTPAMLALAAVCPWGYGAQAGVAGLLGRLLIPVNLVIAYIIFAPTPDFLSFSALDWTPNAKPLFVGAQSVLPFVETSLWGGMFLTLVIAIVGITASLPIGIVLALGRRSEMPVVRAVCIAFIELWRGVPLITVLFMASVMFPLFMPEGMTFDKLLRALIGVMLFSAAYMAEVVRGGLQAIPRGQYEAAEALGLSFWKMMALIVMPQALKLVIPGIVNTFIGLFKDTTLVYIIGLFDFLGMVQLAGTNPDWLGFSHEGYVFVAFGFWIFCFTMSRYSQHLEKKLHTGH